MCKSLTFQNLYKTATKYFCRAVPATDQLGNCWKSLFGPPWGQEPPYVTVPLAPSLVPHDPLLWDHTGIKALPGWAEASKIATNLNIKVRITNICHLREQLEALGQVLHACMESRRILETMQAIGTALLSTQMKETEAQRA